MKRLFVLINLLVFGFISCNKDDDKELPVPFNEFVTMHVWTMSYNDVNYGNICITISFNDDNRYLANTNMNGTPKYDISGYYSADLKNITIQSVFYNAVGVREKQDLSFSVNSYKEDGDNSIWVSGDPHVGPDRAIVWSVCTDDCKEINDNLYKGD